MPNVLKVQKFIQFEVKVLTLTIKDAYYQFVNTFRKSSDYTITLHKASLKTFK